LIEVIEAAMTGLFDGVKPNADGEIEARKIDIFDSDDPLGLDKIG